MGMRRRPHGPAGPGDSEGLRGLVSRPGRSDPRPSGGTAGPHPAADERGRDRHRDGAGPIDRLATSEGPGQGAVRAGRPGRQRPPLTRQRGVHPVLPVGGRSGDGPAGPGPHRRLRVTPAGGLVVRGMTAADADAVRRIYQAGLDGGLASFETTAPSWPVFDAAKLPDHRFVADLDGDVVGWVAVSPVSTRAVYAGVVEHSV